MNMKKPLPDRKRLRMLTFDYAKNGMYYVTLCTHNREKLLADVVNVGTDPRVRPNAAGRMVEKKLPAVEEKFSKGEYPEEKYDKFIEFIRLYESDMR